MTATTPTYGWPYLTLGDAPNIPALGQNGFTAIETTVAGLVAGINASVTALASPTAVAVTAFSSATVTTASTTFVEPGASVGTAFVAPPSGKVSIRVYAESFSSTTQYTLCAPEVKTGATVGGGTLVQAANADFCARMTGTLPQKVGDEDIVSGLTPGATYNVRLLESVGGGTGSWSRRRVIVAPVP